MHILEFFGIFHCTLKNVTHRIIYILSGFSLIMVTIVLTSERFFAIVFPIYHRVYMRKKVLIYLTLSLFVVWAILSMTFYLILPRLTQLSIVNISILSFGLVYTVAVYVKIFSVSRKSATWRGEKFSQGTLRCRTTATGKGRKWHLVKHHLKKCRTKRAVEQKSSAFTAKEKKPFSECYPLLECYTLPVYQFWPPSCIWL